LIECPRDAWQGLKRQIPTELKARYLRALIAAGFKHIDAVSFVSPKAVPQMADSEKVLEQIDVPDDVEIIGIVVNEKGADRAVATKAVTTQREARRRRLHFDGVRKSIRRSVECGSGVPGSKEIGQHGYSIYFAG
jgi:isopropylmalate/homocitrate/citramalate synthase